MANMLMMLLILLTGSITGQSEARAQTCEVCITKKAAAKCKAQAQSYDELVKRGLQAEAVANQCEGAKAQLQSDKLSLNLKIQTLQQSLLQEQIKREEDRKRSKRLVMIVGVAGMVVGIMGGVAIFSGPN